MIVPKYMPCLVLFIVHQSVFGSRIMERWGAVLNRTPATTTTTTAPTTTTPCPTCHVSGKQYCPDWVTSESWCFGDPFMILKERTDLDCVEKHIRGGPGTTDESKVSWAADVYHLGLWRNIPVTNGTSYDENFEKLQKCTKFYGIGKGLTSLLGCEFQCEKYVNFFQKGAPKLPKSH
ncbi:uncharacterized protein LOC129596902 [Paramacrobiotus metropolitanus]|uniref:uncharacterized protein LOC129596902 n=1 Tax=Paramacrobiotus metropolitanus TaxID=2943436 RepID=UPI002445F6FE|nr:uncharacterized protein LOC129596902 [Paramacrobiotus metropolitanus]